MPKTLTRVMARWPTMGGFIQGKNLTLANKHMDEKKVVETKKVGGLKKVVEKPEPSFWSKLYWGFE